VHRLSTIYYGHRPVVRSAVQRHQPGESR
jgi:hypothetical protein